MQLKLICVLLEYLNNSTGCNKVSLDTIKIVDSDGMPLVIKRGDEENSKNLYICPACDYDMTRHVQAQKAKEPLYFCYRCDQIVTEDKTD